MTRRFLSLLENLSAQLLVSAVGLFLMVVSCASLAYAQPKVDSSVISSVDTISDADRWYHRGLSAYLERDYLLARENWLKAAQSQHPKALFNLALLHDRGQLPDSSAQQALKLFKQAANLNYAPAYRQWSRLVRKDNPELAERILSGAPDQQTRQTTKAAQTQQADEVSKQHIIGAINQQMVQPSLQNGTYRTEDWIRRQHDDAWTIQLLAYRNEQDVHRFIEQNSIIKDVAYFVDMDNQGEQYKLLYGVFPTRAAAEQARADLPADLRSQGPWLRRYADIKRALK